ncbi:MAG: phosphatidylcholine/phosphatidylserine synthase [Kiritimatiellia bacterium]
MNNFKIHKSKKNLSSREIPFRMMIPNLVTLMAAASGITSIRYSSQCNWEFAVFAIFIACVLDGLDGRVARMLRATSRMGAELDSLADFVNFGVAPAILVYFWIMEVIPGNSSIYQYRGIFWATALFYAMCNAFRLARFNIMTDEGQRQPYWKHFFLGLPSPGGAGLVLTPAIWQIYTGADGLQNPWIGCSALMICGILMACRCPTLSAKSLKIPSRYMIPVFLAIIFTISMLVSQFWLTLGVIGILYFVSIPICIITFIRMRKRHLETQNATAVTGADLNTVL